MGINAARLAAIRVLGNGCFSHFGVLALERNNSTQLTPGSEAGLLVEGTVGDWYSRAWDTGVGKQTGSHWPFDQLKFREH
jgi:hypothetical protein